MIKILFVCHGNICRSPMAEFIMKDLVLKRGYTLAPDDFDVANGEGDIPGGYDFYIASAATDTDEIGNPMYPPARAKLAEHGIGTPENELGLSDERARLMTKADYDDFDHIILMDKENIRHSRKFVKGDPERKVSMILDYTGRQGESVADPWYTDDYDATWNDLIEGCQAFLSYLEEQGAIVVPADRGADSEGASQSEKQDREKTADFGMDRKPGAALGEDLAWKELRREHIVRDKWIDFRRSAYMFPDGSTFEPFYSYSRRDYVVIVATDEQGRYICVRQFRQGIKEVTTEFPAGGIERADGREYDDARSSSVTERMADVDSHEHADGAGTVSAPGDSSPEAGAGIAMENSLPEAEDPLVTAKRELREETGYGSDEWSHLITIPSSATVSDNYVHVYRAANCHRVGDQDLDVTECLNMVLHTEEEIEDLIYHGDFKQAVHVMAWLLAKR